MCLAVPGQVTSLSTDANGTVTGRVSFGGALKDVSMSFVPDVKVGDYVIVHVGFALSIVDDEEARTILSLFQEISDTMAQAPSPTAHEKV